MLKKIPIPNLDQDIYFERLDNGLEVYLLPFKNKNGYYMSYGVKFGSIDTCYFSNAKKEYVEMPSGIAHFLEHKLFEVESGDKPQEFYSKNGSHVNASTEFTSTRYYVTGNKNPKEDLDYLLSFVSSPYLTDQNVEKEKGIIIEEIKMYDDIPEWYLIRVLREVIFSKSPYKEDIAGTIESVSKITKEDLYDSYKTFYVPNNMFLIVTGNFDKDEIIDVVKNNKFIKEAKPNKKIVRKKYKEPKEVVCKNKELELSINVPKVGYVAKMARSKFSIEDKRILSMCIGIILDILFDNDTSEFIERGRINKWLIELSSSFTITFDDYVILEFLGETNDPDKLLEELKKELKKIEVKEADFERIKKLIIAQEVNKLDSIHTTLDSLHYELVKYGEIYPDKIEFIRNLDFKTFNQVVKDLDFTNSATVIARPKKNK